MASTLRLSSSTSSPRLSANPSRNLHGLRVRGQMLASRYTYAQLQKDGLATAQMPDNLRAKSPVMSKRVLRAALFLM